MDTEGRVAEAGTSNVFFATHHELLVTGFAAAFFAGTLLEVRAVDLVGRTQPASSRHPLVQQLIKSFREFTHQ